MARSVIEVIAWARRQRAGHVITKAVLLVVAAHADRTGFSCPSQRTIAGEAEVSQATASRHVRELIQAGLLLAVRPGAGRSSAGYQLPIGLSPSDSPSASQYEDVVIPSGESLPDGSDSPEGIAPADRSDSQAARSDSQIDRSDSRRRSDQQILDPEVLPTGVEAKEEEAASPPTRAAAQRGSEHPTPAELNATAHGGTVHAIVTAWAAGRSLLAPDRRDLMAAAHKIVRAGGDPTLLPEALDEVHADPQWRNAAACLRFAYERVRRRRDEQQRTSAPAPGTSSARSNAILALRTGGDR